MGVALSDQTVEGVGNFGLLRGGWKVVNAVLRRQHAAGAAEPSAVESAIRTTL